MPGIFSQLPRLAALSAVVLTVWLPVASVAGSSCTTKKMEASAVHKAMQMAWKTRQVLESAQPEVALVARVGSDVSDQGMRYTHMGAVVRDHPQGKWLFVHLLNMCGSDTSGIFDEGLANFYLDSPFAYESVIVIPSPAVQKRLAVLLRGPAAKSMHHPAYSMIAKPLATKYQNSNQWMLEILAMAVAPEGSVTNRTQAHGFLGQTGYQGDTVHISGFQKFGAGFTRANVRFDDHTKAESKASRYEIAGVGSLVRWLDKNDQVEMKRVISLDGPDTDAIRY